MTIDTGWDASAQAWMAQIGEQGDWGRRAVLDPVMIDLARSFSGRAVDIGCGEGRFARMLTALGFDVSGVDPATALIDAARARDPSGDYRVGRAEALPYDDDSFDLAVSYLSLCDVEHLDPAITEVARVLRPGGSFLFANLSSINTAGQWEFGLTRRPKHYAVDNYLKERQVRQRWAGIDVVNWHRPFSTYFDRLLGAGFALRHFSEPGTQGGYAGTKPKFDRMPNFVVMLWKKPA